LTKFITVNARSGPWGQTCSTV